MNVYDQAHALARNLRQHPDVAGLMAAKAKIDADPSAKEMFDNFVENSMRIQMQEMAGTPVDEEEKEKLEKLSEIVFLHADIRAYHEQSMRVDRLLHDLYGILVRAIQPETE